MFGATSSSCGSASGAVKSSYCPRTRDDRNPSAAPTSAPATREPTAPTAVSRRSRWVNGSRTVANDVTLASTHRGRSTTRTASGAASACRPVSSRTTSTASCGSGAELIDGLPSALASDRGPAATDPARDGAGQSPVDGGVSVIAPPYGPWSSAARGTWSARLPRRRAPPGPLRCRPPHRRRRRRPPGRRRRSSRHRPPPRCPVSVPVLARTSPAASRRPPTREPVGQRAVEPGHGEPGEDRRQLRLEAGRVQRLHQRLRRQGVLPGKAAGVEDRGRAEIDRPVRGRLLQCRRHAREASRLALRNRGEPPQ